MRGINRILISGNLAGQPEFARTTAGAEACAFVIVSDRPGAGGVTVKAYVRINAYAPGLVAICRKKLYDGAYLIVEGELMNRDGQRGELLEVRARDVIFPS